MDRAQIDQIVLNLLLNARDAISAVGRVTITTNAVRVAPDGDPFHPDLPSGNYVLVSVSDDGAGMDEQTRSKLFEPFFTTKRQGAGKGLGLSTVYGIVKQNAGFIEIESAPGRGTRIALFFPYATQSPVGPRRDSSLVEVRKGTETILLIDDEQTFLTLTRLLLEDLGYTVVPASSPREGIRLAMDFRGEIHLLLADHIMAEMSGRDLRDQIRAERPGIRCLLMTVSEANVPSHAGASDEHIRFLQTPFTRSGLALTVRTALDDS
jgi:CheY-like chemotaxis protein